MNIKRHIDESFNNDFSKFWTNRLHNIEPIKNSDPRQIFRNTKYLRGIGEHNTGPYLIDNNKLLQIHKNEQKLL